ncbi:Glycosyltransferase involved in cell wall bisynthesis [Filimonas lacunae]|uniref:Glycosyltransferase involved in cell wall bisynthesis n=1 Tax=Filimonas lacunae TaxID=477680 RepID=A0A173MRD1_9BACT|nr:glycosyltransferase [Filimonas lacunae]BAV10235.1 hypothetical protein FLA_6296 [Filimonas lacunae]SIT17973.1 Glycosyltransferase involved in cell wall bisynthesis [Filimonas lacunae]
MTAPQHFKDITLLITHYNRSSSLERLLATFRQLQVSFEAIVVSDDGSQSEHLAYIAELTKTYPFTLVTAAKNSGLGNNINKGQDAVRTPYTVYVQEDFVPSSLFSGRLLDAWQFMEDDASLDVVRFYAYFRYPSLKPFKNGFSEMRFKPLAIFNTYRKFYFYSDHPHLRRSNFFNKFGRYKEGVKGDVTEYKMMMSFLKNKARGLFYDDFTTLFEQRNSSDEPSTMHRRSYKNSTNVFISFVRHVFRHVKFNINYYLVKL